MITRSVPLSNYKSWSASSRETSSGFVWCRPDKISRQRTDKRHCHSDHGDVDDDGDDEELRIVIMIVMNGWMMMMMMMSMMMMMNKIWNWLRSGSLCQPLVAQCATWKTFPRSFSSPSSSSPLSSFPIIVGHHYQQQVIIAITGEKVGGLGRLGC